MPKFVRVLLLLTIAAIVAWLALDGEAPVRVLEVRREFARTPSAREPASTNAPTATEIGATTRERAEILGSTAAESRFAIEGRVIGSEGEPLAGVHVAAYPALRHPWRGMPPLVAASESDADGSFLFPVPSGRASYDLAFTRDDRISQLRFEVGAGDEVLVVLDRGDVARIVVTDQADGAPIEGAAITLVSDSAALPAFTDEQGRAALAIGDDLTLASIRADGYRDARVVLERGHEATAVKLLRTVHDDALHVLVTDAGTGRPIASVVEVSGRTRIDGTAIGGGIHRIPCRVQFGKRIATIVAAGYRRTRVESLPPLGDEPRNAVPVALGPGFEVRGVVTIDGVPLEGARIVVAGGVDPERSHGGTMLGREFDNGERGAFAIEGLDAATAAHLVVFPPEGTTRAASVVPLPLPATPDPDPARRTIDVGTIELAVGRTLRGRVVVKDEDVGIGGATIVAYSRIRFEPPVRLRSDGEGYFELAAITEHHEVLAVTAAEYGETIVDVPPIVDPDRELRIEIERGLAFRGIVVDVNGDRVPGAMIRASGTRPHVSQAPGSPYANPRVEPASAHTHTDADGAFELAGAGKPPWHVQAWRGAARGEATLEAAQKDEELTIVIAPEPALVLRITTFDGAPLPALIEYELREKTEGGWSSGASSSIPQYGGTYMISGITTSIEHDVTVGAAGYARTRVSGIVVAPSEQRVVDVVLAPDTALRGVLRPRDPHPPLDVIRAEVLLRERGVPFGTPLSSRCDEMLNYAFRGLAEGFVYEPTARLLLRGAHGIESEVEVRVEPATIVLGRAETKTLALEYEPPPGVWLTGAIDAASVRAAAGRYAKGVAYRVQLTIEIHSRAADGKSRIRRCRAVELDGAYRFGFAAVAPGKHRVVAKLETEFEGTRFTSKPTPVPAEIEVGDASREFRLEFVNRDR
jgi:hypothetical protein